MDKASSYDVIVVGGGPAGLSAATTLGRSLRRVVVVDAGEPRNAPADGVHNMFTRDGAPPAELLAEGRREVERYGGRVLAAAATTAARTGDGFQVTLESGDTLTARALVVTTGLTDELPDIAGLRERWGRDLIHCPYCHGWEVRDEPLGVIGSGPLSVHHALLFRNWTADLIYFQHTAPDPTPEQAEQLSARGVQVVPGPIDRIETLDDRLIGVRLRTGEFIARHAMVAGPRMAAHSPLLDALGLRPVPNPMGPEVGQAYPADANGATTVPGLWLAGNVTDTRAGVINAAAQGFTTATMLNAALVAEDTAAAVDAARKSPVP